MPASGPPMTLEWGDDEGHHQQIVLPGPGGTIRVVVGEPGRQSGIWRIWANRNTFDVYIAVRTTAGYRKWSLHETGDWRFQWVSEDRATEFGWESRIIDQWQRPDEIAGTGVTMSFSIRVRHRDLVHYDDPEVVPVSVDWIPAPPEGHMTGLHVALMRPDQGVVSTPGLVPLTGFTLSDRRAVVLFGTVEPVPDELNRSVDSAISAAHEAIKQSGVDVDNIKNPRMTLAGYTDNGHRFVWDAAVTDGSDNPC